MSSMFMYHVEISLCQSCLFEILGKSFRRATARDVNELIQIHHLVLDASAKFDRLLSRQWCLFLFNILAVVIAITYMIIAFSVHRILSVVAVSLFGILCRACILGELVQKSSLHIQFLVYESDWVNIMSQLRRELSLVILRSQKPVYMTAGFLGNLDLPKVTSIVKNWYKTVQALLKTL